MCFCNLVHYKLLASCIYFDYCAPFPPKGKFTISTKTLVQNVANENHYRKLKTFDMWKIPSIKKEMDCHGADGQQAYINYTA